MLFKYKLVLIVKFVKKSSLFKIINGYGIKE